MPGTYDATKALPISGRGDLNSDPTRNFRFLVTFQPYDGSNPIGHMNFGFTSVSGMSMGIEAIPYREGGMNVTLHQIPGQATFSPITLTRGVHLGNSQAWKWAKKLFAAVGPGGPGLGGAAPNYNFRTSVTVHVLQHPLVMGNEGSLVYSESDKFSRNDPVAYSFRFYNAWITSLAYSDLNAGDNAVSIEQMALVHEGMDMYWNPTLGNEDAYDQTKLESGLFPAGAMRSGTRR